MGTANKIKSFSGLFIFKIQEKEFCLDIKEIINIIKVSECKIQLNDSYPELVYAGNKYKLISLDKIYNLKNQETSKTRVILIKSGKKLAGFFADEIIEIMAVDESSSKISYINSDCTSDMKLVIRNTRREMIMPDFEQIIPCF